MISRMLTVVKLIVALFGAALFAGLGIGSSRIMPDYAMLYVDDETKTYLAPPCVLDTAGLRMMRADEVGNSGYAPDARCRDQGAFIQEDRSLTGKIFEWVGVLKPFPSRWNEDGSWNY